MCQSKDPSCGLSGLECGCGDTLKLTPEQLKEKEDMELVQYQDMDDEDEDKEVIIMNGQKPAGILTTEELYEIRDECIQELKDKQITHKTPTAAFLDYLVRIIAKVAECRRLGLPCRLPIIAFQCATKTHSVANGGRFTSGAFKDNQTCRNSSVLFSTLPRDIDFGILPVVAVNAYDECPIGEYEEDSNGMLIIIIKCPIWIIIIAMERAELINIFAKHAKKMGADLFLGGLGGTSTGVDLLYKYIDFTPFSVVVKPVTHIVNASTSRWRPGWGWPNKVAQIVRLYGYIKLISDGLVRFYGSSSTTLFRTPLQAMIEHPAITFVTDLSDVDPSEINRWEIRDRALSVQEIAARYRPPLCPEAIKARSDFAKMRYQIDLENGTGLPGYIFGQSPEDIKKRHDANVRAYQTNKDNNSGLYSYTHDPSPEAAAKRSAAVKKGNDTLGEEGRSAVAVKRFQTYVDNDTGLYDFKTNQSPEAKKKRSDASAKAFKNNTGLSHYTHSQAPAAKKKRSDASTQAAINRGGANWTPYDHNGTRVDPEAELQAFIAANPRLQGFAKKGGKPCIKWSEIQDSDLCIYLNDGNDKRGDKATVRQAQNKWRKYKK